MAPHPETHRVFPNSPLSGRAQPSYRRYGASVKWQLGKPKLVRRLHDNRLLAAALDGKLRLDELPPDLQDDVRIAHARRVLAQRDGKS